MHDRFRPIVLKNSVGGSAGQISSKSQKLASSNISDLAWRPTRKTRSGNPKFVLAGLFQHNRPNADISWECAAVFGRSHACLPVSQLLQRPLHLFDWFYDKGHIVKGLACDCVGYRTRIPRI